jgi:DHA1 family inner membrane transport protein
MLNLSDVCVEPHLSWRALGGKSQHERTDAIQIRGSPGVRSPVMTSNITHQLDTRGLLAAVLLGTLGALTIMVVPGFVMLIAAQSGLDDRQLGFIASWDINSMAAAIGAATLLISRCNWRHLAVAGAALLVLGNLWTAASHGYTTLAAARVLTGIGEGLTVAVSFAALGSASNPDRAFGIYLVAGLTVSAALLALLPWLEASVGAPAVFSCIALLTAASSASVLWLPRCNPGSVQWETGAPPVCRELAISGLVGVFLYFIAQGAMWSYFERIGRASGVDAAVIGEAMGLSSFAGMAGALLAVSVCTRFGRVLPLVASGFVSVVSFWMLRGRVSGTELVIAGVLFNFAWNLAQPLLSGVCAEADAQGRVVVAMGCIQTVGFGVGPALAAMTLREHDFSRTVWLSTAVLTVSLIIVLSGLRARRLRTPTVSVLRPT